MPPDQQAGKSEDNEVDRRRGVVARGQRIEFCLRKKELEERQKIECQDCEDIGADEVVQPLRTSNENPRASDRIVPIAAMDAIAEGRCAAPPLLAAKAVMTSPIRLATVALCCGRGHSHTSVSGACCRRCGPAE